METLPELLRPYLLKYTTSQDGGTQGQACLLVSAPNWPLEAKGLRMETKWWNYSKSFLTISAHRIIVFLPTLVYSLDLWLLFLASSFSAAGLRQRYLFKASSLSMQTMEGLHCRPATEGLTVGLSTHPKLFQETWEWEENQTQHSPTSKA